MSDAMTAVDGRYEVVPARLRHVPEIPPLQQAAAAMFSSLDVPPKLRYLVTADEALHEAQRDGRLWVAEHRSERAVGFALAEIIDGEAYLTEVDVHPEHARRGVGTRLVETVVDWASGGGFTYLLLVTFRHLPWNAPFYRKLGFVPLTGDEMGPELCEIFAEEAEAGIDVRKRIAMRLELSRRAGDRTK